MSGRSLPLLGLWDLADPDRPKDDAPVGVIDLLLLKAGIGIAVAAIVRRSDSRSDSRSA